MADQETFTSPAKGAEILFQAVLSDGEGDQTRAEKRKQKDKAKKKEKRKQKRAEQKKVQNVNIELEKKSSKSSDTEECPSSFDQLFETQLTRGKGLGLFALQDIPAGTRIFTEAPLVAFSTTKPVEEEIIHRFKNLSVEKKAAFTDLYAPVEAPPAKPVNSRIQSKFLNTIPIGYKPSICAIFNNNAKLLTTPSEGIALSPSASRLNHSCTPNTTLSTTTTKTTSSAESQTLLVLHANITIPTGTELTINYLSSPTDLFNSLHERHTLLTAQKSLDCSCPACDVDNLSTQTTLQATEAQRKETFILSMALQDPVATPDIKIKSGDALNKLCKGAGLCGDELAWVYNRLAAAHVAAKKRDSNLRARSAKIREREVLRTCFGMHSHRVGVCEEELRKMTKHP